MNILEESSIKLNQSFNTKEEAIRAAGEILVKGQYVKEGYIDEMIKRDKNVSTYMGNFIAIPHGTENSKDLINKSGISIVQIPGGIDFGTPEEEKLVTIVFGIAGVGDEHLDILSKIAIYCSEVENVVKLADASSEHEIKELLEGIE